MRVTPEERAVFRKFASFGGKARAANLTPKRRTAIAKKASKARWAGHVKKSA